jgi:hypothetical protein
MDLDTHQGEKSDPQQIKNQNPGPHQSDEDQQH